MTDPTQAAAPDVQVPGALRVEDPQARTSAYFDEVTSAFLDGNTTVPLRPISYDEVAALTGPDAPNLILGYAPTRTGGDVTFAPAAFTLTPGASRTSDVKGTKPGPLERSVIVDHKNVVGQRVRVEYRTAFRQMGDLSLYTTPQADAAVTALGGFNPPGSGRDGLWVLDPAAAQVPLAPIWGSYATVSFAVPGVTPTVLAARVREVLDAEFGTAEGRVVKVLTSAVEDDRVDVCDAQGRLVAVNVLGVEVATLLAEHGQGIQTRPSRGHAIVVGH